MTQVGSQTKILTINDVRTKIENIPKIEEKKYDPVDVAMVVQAIVDEVFSILKQTNFQPQALTRLFGPKTRPVTDWFYEKYKPKSFTKQCVHAISARASYVIDGFIGNTNYDTIKQWDKYHASNCLGIRHDAIYNFIVYYFRNLYFDKDIREYNSYTLQDYFSMDVWTGDISPYEDDEDADADY